MILQMYSSTQLTSSLLGGWNDTFDPTTAKSAVAKSSRNAGVACVVLAVADLPALVTHSLLPFGKAVKAAIERLLDVVLFRNLPSTHRDLVFVLSAIAFGSLQSATLQAMTVMTRIGTKRTASEARLIRVAAPTSIALVPRL